MSHSWSRHVASLSLPLLWCAAVGVAAAQSPFVPDATAKIENLVAFTEGPAWHARTQSVLFTDIANNRIMRLDRNRQLHIYRTPSGRANGLLFDRQGRLLMCEGGGEGGNRRVTRAELDGTFQVLTDRFEGRRYNSPNDLAQDSRGNVYFSDPRYGPRDDIEQRDEQGRAIEGVYRIDTEGQVTRVITHEVDRPNGLAVSADDRFLFVADNVNDGPNDGVGGNRKLWRFDLLPDGRVAPESRKLLFDWGTDRGPDGMTLAPDGRLLVAAGFNVPKPPAETSQQHKAGIYVIPPDGGRIDAFLPVLEDMITNCTLGGPDGKTLYITAGHKLWSVRLK